MSIEGRIAIDVSFADTATSSGVQSLKKIALTDTQSYTSGKVAIVTGTCGTAAVQAWAIAQDIDYKDANGNAVQMSTVNRIAFQASPSAVVRGSGTWGTIDLTSLSNQPSISAQPVYETPQFGGTLNIRTITGTASYTLVLYGT